MSHYGYHRENMHTIILLFLLKTHSFFTIWLNATSAEYNFINLYGEVFP